MEPPPADLPAAPPRDPAVAWLLALFGLGPHGRVVVEENAAFVAFAGGTLVLEVRNELWRTQIGERLREADFVEYLPGFRRFELRLGGAGRTGREVRTAAEERRAVAAQAAVAASPEVHRLVALLGGRVEHTEAPPDVGASGAEPGAGTED